MAAESHAQTRASERYGLVLTRAELGGLVINIGLRDGAIYQCLAKRGGEIWKVRVKGLWAFVVYRPATKSIATFLTPDQAARHGVWLGRGGRRQLVRVTS